VAFSLFGLNVHWYGLIITVGMVLSVLYAMHHAKMERVKTDDVVDLALYLIIFGVLGARLYYVIMEFDSYLVTGGTFFQNLGKKQYNMIAVWNGGLAIYGGIIAGVITAYVVARCKRIRFPIIADIAGPSVLVGQILGRWGNFFNAEAYGGETTLPWRMGILKSMDGGQTFYSEMYVHPTFFYESLWNLAGLILVTAFYKKKKFHGQMFVFYMIWYGFGRMLIEGLRADSLYVGNLRISQFVGFVSFVFGVILMIVNLRRVRAKGTKADSYEPVYAAVSAEAEKETAAETEASENEENHEEKE
jgi:phosphatidylglycerol:prolipoprotein diacylglycerol transferase